MIKIDKKDMLILACLRENSRQNLTNISKKTNTPVSTIFDKLKSYNQTIIKKHTSLIDFAKLGFNARANIAVKVDRSEREKLQDFLFKSHNVNSLTKTNNGFDFLMEAVFRHIKDVEDFMDDIEGRFKIKSKEIHYTIDEIKKEGFLSGITSVDLIK